MIDFDNAVSAPVPTPQPGPDLGGTGQPGPSDLPPQPAPVGESAVLPFDPESAAAVLERVGMTLRMFALAERGETADARAFRELSWADAKVLRTVALWLPDGCEVVARAQALMATSVAQEAMAWQSRAEAVEELASALERELFDVLARASANAVLDVVDPTGSALAYVAHVAPAPSGEVPDVR